MNPGQYYTLCMSIANYLVMLTDAFEGGDVKVATLTPGAGSIAVIVFTHRASVF